MKRWTKLSIGVAAVALAIAAGTAAFAIRGDDDNATERPSAAQDDGGAAGGISPANGTQPEGEDGACAADDCDDPQNHDGAAGGTSPALGMCAPGVTDCVDMVVDPGAEACAADDCDAPQKCAPDTACEIYERCMESPLPLDEYPIIEGTVAADPAAGEGIAVGEPAPGTSTIVNCEPVDDPCSPEPDPNVRCLPPDCAVSSDGSVACPGNPPECAVDGNGTTAPETVPCSAPAEEPTDPASGSAGSGTSSNTGTEQ